MKRLLSTVKRILFPDTAPEVRTELDVVNLKNLRMVSICLVIFEILVVSVFLATRSAIDSGVITSLISVSLGILFSVCSVIVSSLMLRRSDRRHRSVALLMVIAFAVMSVWGGFASYRHYLLHEQMLTFFAVQLMTVCFLVYRPIAGIVLMGAAYSGLYLALYLHDGAETINTYNYAIIALLSMACVVVRYHRQASISEKNTALQQINEKLNYASHHDALTGLRNRIALDDDTPGLLGRELLVAVCDINNFKKINDTHGHGMGDYVLTCAGHYLQRLFPDGLIYRYGGDEFLMIVPREQGAPLTETERMILTAEDAFSISRCKLHAHISIGGILGSAGDDAALQSMIDQADQKMYTIKNRTVAVTEMEVSDEL